MDKIVRQTPDLTQENVDRLAELFPSVVTEALDAEGNLRHVVDFDVLRDLLSDDAVEGRRERYQFTWPGKAKARLEARTPTSKTMRPCPEKSVDWDTTQNLYIEGDNLEALKIMRETYVGKVKLIYIDPPYNTGHDFIYDDDFAQTRADYDAESGDFDERGGRLVANLEGNGRFHSDWCSMMYPRLQLARDMLSSDGAIFISIDDNESKNLRAICDEVFGAGCFVGDIAWQRTYSIRNDSKGVPREVEHLLCYSKQLEWIPGKLPRTDGMNSKYKNPDGDRSPWRTDNAYAPGAKTHQGMVYAIQHPFTGELLYPAIGSCWRYQQDIMLSIMNGWCPYELKDLGDTEKRAEICKVAIDDVKGGVKGIVLSRSFEESKNAAEKVKNTGPWPRFFFTRDGLGGIARKTYLDDVGGKLATNFWPFSETGHTDEAMKQLQGLFDGNAPFDTPKPVRLMDRILTIATDSDSLVLDFFSGSASMAHAVIQKNAEDGGNRQFILVQIPEETSGEYATLCEVGEERIRRAGAKIVAEVEEANSQLKIDEEPKPVPDVGFRVLRVDDSVLKDTFATPADTQQASLFDLVDNLEDGATDLDLLFQVLPKFRIEYSANIEKRDIGGNAVFDVNEGQLLACFDSNVSTEAITAIAKERPLYAVFRDTSFTDDSAVANLEELFKTLSPETIRRVI